MEIPEPSHDGWLDLCRRIVAARKALSPQVVAQIREEGRGDWLRFLAELDAWLPHRSRRELEVFFNRLSQAMLAALPPEAAAEWRPLWLEFSDLKDGTRMSIFDGLAEGEDAAWLKLAARYEDFVRGQFQRWAGQGRLDASSLDDLLQQFYIRLWESLPKFQRQRVGSFRRWMRLLAADVVRGAARSDRLRLMAELPDQLHDDRSEISRQWDREHRKHILKQALAEVGKTTDPRHLALFVALSEKGPDETVEAIAARFEFSRANADKIKSRVLGDVKSLLERWGER